MANRLIVPFQVEHTLLYSSREWIEREMPMIVCPVRELAEALRIRPVQIQEALQWLLEAGVLKTYEWNKTYFTATIVPPIGMRMNINKEIAYE
jgi:hypothetical protein